MILKPTWLLGWRLSGIYIVKMIFTVFKNQTKININNIYQFFLFCQLCWMFIVYGYVGCVISFAGIFTFFPLWISSVICIIVFCRILVYCLFDLILTNQKLTKEARRVFYRFCFLFLNFHVCWICWFSTINL